MASGPLYYDRVLETSTTTGTGTYTLAGAVTGYQSFGAVGNTNTCPYAAWEVDANGNASGGWEVGVGTYTVSGTTLARTTVLSSSNSGAAVNWGAGTRRMAVSLPASVGIQAAQAGYGAIQGLELVYSSTTAIIVNAGKCSVNNAFPTFSQTTYTSGSTMKDIANATVTLAASSSYWVFISSGGVIGIEINDGTGDGQVPLFDTTLDYWKAASTGTAWRRIGKFWTDGSAHIFQFSFENRGRYRRMILGNASAIILVNAGTAGSYSTVTITPYITGDDVDYDLTDSAPACSASYCSHQLSVDGGANPVDGVFGAPVFTYFIPPKLASLPNTGSLKYQVTGGTNDIATISLAGVGMVV